MREGYLNLKTIYCMAYGAWRMVLFMLITKSWQIAINPSSKQLHNNPANYDLCSMLHAPCKIYTISKCKKANY